MLFRNRVEAGKSLASLLAKYKDSSGVVLSFPCGGAICGAYIAGAFELPHDLVFVNKISHPHSPDYAVGAVNERGSVVLKGEAATLDKMWLEHEIESKVAEIRRRRHTYLTNRLQVPLRGKTVILVDDCLSDESVLLAAVDYLKHHQADKIVIAGPVIYRETADKIRDKVSEIIGVHIVDDPITSEMVYSGDKVSDGDVIKILQPQISI